MKKLKLCLFSLIPFLFLSNSVFADGSPTTLITQKEQFMTGFLPTPAGSVETTWFTENLSTNVNINNSNFDVVPLAYYYVYTANVESNVVYTTSFSITLKYHYDIYNNANYTFAKNKDKYVYAVYNDYINSYTCSISKDTISKYSNYYVEDIDISCSYNFKQNVSNAYVSLGLNGQPTWVNYGLNSFNGKVVNNLYATITNAKTLKYNDSSSVIIDQNNKIIDQQQEQNKTSKGILSKITSIFDWLTNKDSADVSGANKIAGYLPPGPLDSIINLPLTFFQNLNTNLSKTCTPLDVPIPYLNKTIQIPCINNIFNQIDGLPNLWNWVGTIMSIFILYRYLIALYKYYDDLTTLKANFISDWGSI